MDIIQELENMRHRMLREINTEFDVLIDYVKKNTNTPVLPEYREPYETEYPLTAGGAIFKGKKPTGVIIDGKYTAVRTWKQLVGEVMKVCIADKRYGDSLRYIAGKVSGRTRQMLSSDGKDMRSPMKIEEGLFMETHYDTETLLNIMMTRILSPIGYDYSRIRVTVRSK